VTPALTHVGMTVPDLDLALRWYGEVVGLEPLGRPIEVRAGEGHAAAVAADVFGDRFAQFRQAHLATANGAAIELFEFPDPPIWASGIFHVCLAAPEIEELAKRIVGAGGRQRTSRVWEIFEGESYRTCYCEDPFGNVLELYSHSHERTYANR
jgi:catechol 2,3-dioxygenase-like lactoylglutathione lyase family enzyme